MEHILNKIKEYNKIIIHRHNNPDGDCLGSQLGLKHIIEDNFPNKQVYVVGDVSDKFNLIDNCKMDELSIYDYYDALTIILDCGYIYKISDNRYTLGTYTIRIDHHPFYEKICDYEWIDNTYESTCSMVAQFVITNNLTITSKSAKALFTGMVTDSNRFLYKEVSSRTFNLASILSSYDFSMRDLYYQIYSEDFSTKKLKATLLLKTQFTKNNVAYIYTSIDEYKQYLNEYDRSPVGLIDILDSIKGVEIYSSITQKENEFIFEFRSRRYSILDIARKYGGGGHTLACSCKLKTKQRVDSLLQELDEYVYETNNK